LGIALVLVRGSAGRRLTDTTTATNKATYSFDQAGRLATINRVNGATTTTQTRAYTPLGLVASVANVTGTTTATTGIDWDNQAIPQPVGFVSAGLTDLVNGPGGWAAKVVASNTAIAQDTYGSATLSTGFQLSESMLDFSDEQLLALREFLEPLLRPGFLDPDPRGRTFETDHRRAN
jgi:YD repeat-containing protein